MFLLLVSGGRVGAQDASAGSGAAPASDDLWTRATLTGNWGGIRSNLSDSGVTLAMQEQSELWVNPIGGLKTGVVYDGLTTPSVTVNFDKLLGWSGASFFVNAFQIHGRGPSGNLLGNMQLVSNIEATRDTKLYDLWLEQDLLNGRLSLRIGQEGANDEMMTSQYGALFLNSSFGFPGLAAADLPSGGPNYPMATPFARLRFQITDQLTFTGAVYNGDPAPPGTGDPQLRDAGGTAFRLGGGTYSFAEFWYSINQDPKSAGLPATYKLGTWYSTSHFSDQRFDTAGIPLASPASDGVPRDHHGGYAIYGIMDQMIWRRSGTSDQGIGLFLQVMGAPASYNVSNLFIEGGLNWKAPFGGRDSDVLGLAVSYLGISPTLQDHGNDVIAFTGGGVPYASNETVLELTYLYQATPWWTLEPDVQIVLNPGAGIPVPGQARLPKDACIAGVRATITF